MNPIAELVELAGQLPALIAGHEAALAQARARLAELKTAGLIYATSHWREGKYLYLIYPQRDGRRTRKYIGSDPKRIADAQAGIQRAAEFDRLSAEVRAIESRLLAGQHHLHTSLSYLSSGPDDIPGRIWC